MISAFIQQFRPRLCAAALVLLVLILGSPGCGSSGPNETAEPQAKGESRFHYEGTGKNKQEVLVRRRDERIRKQREAAQKGEQEAAKAGE